MPEPSRIATGRRRRRGRRLLHRFHTEFYEPSPGAEVLEPRVREHVQRGLSVFLLAGPRSAGLAQLRFRDYVITGTPMCYLEELYVVPDRRGEGHGRRLMETAFEVARERGATTMDLGTALDDTAARSLYESLGFTNLEQEGQPATQMLYYEREL